ncbi:MAG TPA: tetratricopeptide repeat protein [Nitrospira sp.]|nr:tetratricopeptide repeat protein [Nitrospira sp.]
MAVMSFSGWATVPPVLGQPVSTRTLSGDELVRIGEIHDVQNHFPEALTYYEQALASYRAHKQRKGEAIVQTKIGSVFERQGRRQEAAVQLRQAVKLFAKTADSPVYADALFLSGRVSLWLGDRDDAAALFERAKERYGRAHNVQALGLVTLQAGLLKVSDGPSDEGLREIERTLEAARQRRDEEQTLTSLVALGDGNWILDRFQAAGAHYEEALALLERRPQATTEAGLRFRLAALNAAMGREEEGVNFAKRAVTLYQSLRDVSGEAATWSLLASLHHTLGHGEDAEQALRRALEIYHRQQLNVHAIRAAMPPTTTSPKEFR